MSVVLIMCAAPEASGNKLMRWLGLLGHDGLMVRGAAEARQMLRSVRIDISILDVTPASTGAVPNIGEEGDPIATRAELAAIEVLEVCADSRATVFIVGAAPRSYRFFRDKLATSDRFFTDPPDSEMVKRAIADFFESQSAGPKWVSQPQAQPRTLNWS